MAVLNPVLPEGWLEAPHGWRLDLRAELPGTWTITFEVGKSITEGPAIEETRLLVDALFVCDGVVVGYRDILRGEALLTPGQEVVGFARLYVWDVLAICSSCGKPFTEKDVRGVSYEDAVESAPSFCGTCEWNC